MQDTSTLFSVADVWTFSPLLEQPQPAPSPKLDEVTEAQKADLFKAIASRPDGMTFIEMDFVAGARCHTDGERHCVISALLSEGLIVAVPKQAVNEWTIYTTVSNWDHVAGKRLASAPTAEQQEPAKSIGRQRKGAKSKASTDEANPKPVKSIDVTWHNSNQAGGDARHVLQAVREAKKIRRPIDLARKLDMPLDRVTMAVAVLECQRLVMRTEYANGPHITPTSREQHIDYVENTYGIDVKLD